MISTGVDVVGVIGLGVMGGAMARRLLGAGYAVVGYDPDVSQLDRLAAVGGSPAAGPSEVAARCGLVVTSLPNDASLELTCRSFEGAIRQGTVVADTSTLSVEAKRSAHARVGSLGGRFLDAPVSGTGLQAAAGDLVMMASGDAEAIDSWREAFGTFCREVVHVGDVPHGTHFKYVANLLVAVHTLAAAEAHALAAASGLDPRLVQQVIEEGVGTSRMWQIRGPMMVEDAYDPPAARLDIFVKDIALIAEHARRLEAPVALLRAASEAFGSAAEQGLGSLDAAAVRRLLNPPWTDTDDGPPAAR